MGFAFSWVTIWRMYLTPCETLSSILIYFLPSSILFPSSLVFLNPALSCIDPELKLCTVSSSVFAPIEMLSSPKPRFTDKAELPRITFWIKLTAKEYIYFSSTYTSQDHSRAREVTIKKIYYSSFPKIAQGLKKETNKIIILDYQSFN